MLKVVAAKKPIKFFDGFSNSTATKRLKFESAFPDMNNMKSCTAPYTDLIQLMTWQILPMFIADSGSGCDLPSSFAWRELVVPLLVESSAYLEVAGMVFEQLELLIVQSNGLGETVNRQTHRPLLVS